MNMTVIWSGLVVGAVYAIVALQYDLIFTATGVFNFAQASYVVLGSFLVYQFVNLEHWPTWVFIIACAVVMAMACAIQEVISVRALQWTGRASQHTELVTTLGAASIIAGIALVKWGAQPLSVEFPGPSQTLTVLGGRVQPVGLLVIVVAILACLLSRVFLRRTRVGLSALATAEDRDGAALLGVNVSRLALGAFAVAGAVAGATVIVIAPITYASYDLGNTLVLKAFVALALGGFGVQYGGLIGGLLIGLIETETTYYFEADVAALLLLGLLLAVLLVRPQGLLGARGWRAI
jgi:branched-chain amino acid transport system permease protein